MLFNRFRPTRSKKTSPKVEHIQELDEFLEKRDYTGAMAILEHRMESDASLQNLLWLAYCAYHGGEYIRAISVYLTALKTKDSPPEVNLYLSSAYLMMGQIEDARKVIEKQPKGELQNRIMLHIGNALDDLKKVMYHHSLLTTSVEDQLAYAAVNFQRGHYNEAMITYKKLIVEHGTFRAINIYLGLCYFKLDFYDEALSCAKSYLEEFPDSPTATNLAAACTYRLEGHRSAEQMLRKLKHVRDNELSFAKDLILHNLVVFRNGENALVDWPPLVNVVPEASRNLIIYHLKRNDVDAAYTILEQLDGRVHYDQLLKALVYVALGNEKRQHHQMVPAATYFKHVADSKDDENTIIGRLSMASYMFINERFDDALVYYNSVAPFNKEDNAFNFNYGQANLQVENYRIASESLSRVKDPRYVSLHIYQLSLLRTLIRSRQAPKAWQFYEENRNSPHVIPMLKLIANDCYQIDEYLIAAMAFEALGRLESHNETYSLAKQGACMGVLKLFVTQRADRKDLESALRILEVDCHPDSLNLVSRTQIWLNEATLIA